MPTQPKVYTVKDVSVILQTHPSTIYRMLKRGEITGFKVGSDWRFNIDQVEDWRLNHAPGKTGPTKWDQRRKSPKV